MVVPIPKLGFFLPLLFLSCELCSSYGLLLEDSLYWESLDDPNLRNNGNGFSDESEPATRPRLNSMAIQYSEDVASTMSIISTEEAVRYLWNGLNVQVRSLEPTRR